MYRGNNYIQGTFGTITVPTGYKLLGVIPFPSYADRFLVTFGFGEYFTDNNSNVPLYYVIENKYGEAIQQQVTATAVFIKNENFVTI